MGHLHKPRQRRQRGFVRPYTGRINAAGHDVVREVEGRQTNDNRVTASSASREPIDREAEAAPPKGSLLGASAPTASTCRSLQKTNSCSMAEAGSRGTTHTSEPSAPCRQWSNEINWKLMSNHTRIGCFTILSRRFRTKVSAIWTPEIKLSRRWNGTFS
jgi:hypothetical protein